MSEPDKVRQEAETLLPLIQMEFGAEWFGIVDWFRAGKLPTDWPGLRCHRLANEGYLERRMHPEHAAAYQFRIPFVIWQRVVQQTDPTRFVGNCTCRVACVVGTKIFIGGEDDCPEHGFGPEEEPNGKMV